ncbi:LOW QUALITY PROTEIN: hypothetical protein QYF61_011137 [Mycteria americana]|uniref:Uncharacterized protein n=1 Tax=Mycteria americana TaxID=33587 RepID=A0AAN7NRY4_MYCAM|nr:LOW QUALITY PROTEIN: hypothetical protein QYF61_011137 [Mycteria americana]
MAKEYFPRSGTSYTGSSVHNHYRKPAMFGDNAAASIVRLRAAQSRVTSVAAGMVQQRVHPDPPSPRSSPPQRYDISASCRPVSDDEKRGSTVLALLLSPPLLPAHISQRSCPRGGGAPDRGSPGRAVPQRPGVRREAASAPRLAAPRGCAQRRGGGIAPRPAEAAASARPRRPPPCPAGRAGRPHGSGAPLAAGPAGLGGACGVSLQWLLWYRGAAPAGGGGCAPRGVRPSVHPSLRGRRLVCACVCVTDSAARTARGQPPSRSQPGAAPARPGAAAPSPSPGALPGGGDLSGLAAPPPPSWRVTLPGL